MWAKTQKPKDAGLRLQVILEMQFLKCEMRGGAAQYE